MADDWSRIECEVIIEDYFDMLIKELSGINYNKAEHRRALQKKLNSRSEGSIEYKHQNISAVLLNAGNTYIPGYKPAWNYQNLLESVVLERLDQHSNNIRGAEDKLLEKEAPDPVITDWHSVLVGPPERISGTQVKEPRFVKYKQTDFSEREARNRKLGLKGEQFVIEFEKKRLQELGRDDLLPDLEWTSKNRGDGFGYDIRSFDGKTDIELFIEVKTTNAGKYQPFLITSNEVEFSESNSDQYSLYRVFEFSEKPKLFSLTGRITNNVRIIPKIYKASFQE